jgi:hypothetical protein
MPVIDSCKFQSGTHANGEKWAGHVTVRRMAPAVSPWDAAAWFREVCLAVARQAESPRLREAAAGMARVLAGGGTPAEAHDRHGLFGGFACGFALPGVYATWALTEARLVAQRALSGDLRRDAFGWGAGYNYLAGQSGMSLPALPADADAEFTFPTV